MNTSVSDGVSEHTGGFAHYRALHVINLLLLVGLWAFTIIGYGNLPDHVPAHFNAAGEVTGWMTRDSGVFVLLPVIGSFHAALMYAFSTLADASPAGINVPHKKRLLAMERDAQRYALEPTRPFMFLMTSWLLVLTLVIQIDIYFTALAGPDATSRMGLAPLLFLCVLPLAGVWWLSRSIRRRIDESELGEV